MPRTRGEDDKKHGDTLESLIERTGGSPSARERSESADEEPELVPDDEDDPAPLEDDDDDDEEDDEDDEDLNDDAGEVRDVGEQD